MFYFKDLTSDESHCVIDPNFSLESLDLKTKKAIGLIRHFNGSSSRPIISGDIRFHLIGHECEKPENFPTIDQIRKNISEHGYLDCNLEEFVWFCVNRLPQIDRPLREFEVTTLGVAKKIGRFITYPMISKIKDVSEPMGQGQLLSADQKFPRKAFALAVEKL